MSNASPEPPLLPFEERPSVETLATLSEDEAVRRRFDARNHWVLRWSFRVFLVAAAIELLTAGDSGDLVGAAVAVADLLLTALGLLVLHRIQPKPSSRSSALAFLDPIARRTVGSFRAATLAAFGLQAFLFIVFSAHAGNAEPWLIMLALVVAALRLLPSEALLLQGLMVGLAFGASLVPVRPPDASRSGRRAAASPVQIMPVLACNAVGLAIGLLRTRRLRRGVLTEWRTLREGAREQLRMREELDFARRVQLSMLPARSPALDWIEMAGRSLPATEVGGDYFDYFPVGPGSVAVVSADVAGHGLASGLILSGLRSCLALLADELAEPAEVARKLDRMVRQTTSHRMLVTLAIALFDRDARAVTVTSAGHPPILHRSSATGRVEPVAFSSLPLGASLRGRFEERRVPFAPGDLFLLYTDGVYEALGADGQPYGLERLARLVERLAPDASPEDACAAILADLASVTGRRPAEDDVTLVAVRVR